MCIFHSRDTEWKRNHDFASKFHELLQLLDTTGFGYDFAEFVFVGNELQKQRGVQTPILRITDMVFHKEAVFEGASFLDDVEFNGVEFVQGVTFKRSHFLKGLEFTNTRCRSLDFEKAKLEGITFFTEVDCVSQACFNSTQFTGATDGYVVKLEGVRVGGLTTFADSAFMLGDESAVGFLNVRFEDFADFNSSHFRCHVQFDRVSFASVTEFIDTIFDSVGSAARYRGAAVQFDRIEVKQGGSLTFMSTDPNNKMFNHDVSIGFIEDPAGIVRFENVHFNRLLARGKEQLTRLAKLGLVEIGPGCIKYRFQTGVRTIFVDQGNAPLVLELCQTFTNYFTVSNGLNLGFEIVERDKSKISFFYFTDEDISEVEFFERLARTEEGMWNLLSTNSGERFLAIEESPGVAASNTGKSVLINAVDGISALLGTFFRVGVRIAVGAWGERDTHALLGAIRFNDEGAQKRAEGLHRVLVEKYTGRALFGINQQQNQFLPTDFRRHNSPEPPMIKILFLGANSSRSHLDLEKEVSKIQNSLKLAQLRDTLELKQEWAVTVDSLIQAMLDESPDIVHFAGHGDVSGIKLKDEAGYPKVVSADALSSLFKLFEDSVRCVVLNSCYSEHQARAIRQHIPYVIGMRAKIPDAAAIAFSTGFYKALGAGRDVPFAFDMGKTCIKMEGISYENTLVLL